MTWRATCRRCEWSRLRSTEGGAGRAAMQHRLSEYHGVDVERAPGEEIDEESNA
jgi:hypothetical protein